MHFEGINIYHDVIILYFHLVWYEIKILAHLKCTVKEQVYII